MDPIERPDYSLPPSQMSVRLPRVKNKAPADVQITGEQLIAEALSNQVDDMRPPRVQINDDEELEDYMHRKRAEFENIVRKQRHHISSWVKYASFEEGLGDLKRARSVFERAINVDYRNTSLWLKYAEMEMRHKYVNHARNVWERAVYLHPRVDQFWYKYTYMEEMLSNYRGARSIFERWMQTEPTQNAWILYSKFEERMGELQKAREVMYRMIHSHPQVSTFIKVAKFEEKHRNRLRARQVYQKAIEELGPHAYEEELFLEFTDFEIKAHEYENARMLFNFALEKIPKAKAPKLYHNYINFEKQYGSTMNLEIVVLNKRRALYEQILAENPMKYDTWFDYIKLEESQEHVNRIREVYERAIANLPPSNQKKHWRRYIYFWINYAVFEEKQKEPQKAREIYNKALEVIPHQHFSFSKLWVLYAHFEVRQKDLEKARKILGNGIAKSGNDRVFEAYIELETQLGCIDRCRRVYQKWIESNPASPKAWIRFGELERTLGETERSTAIMELAISQSALYMPEVVWKAYIDMELGEGNIAKVRELYTRLLGKTKHLKVWVSYSELEYSQNNPEKAREVLQEAEEYFRDIGDKESRLLLLEHWIESEDPETAESLKAKLPRKVKKKRQIEGTDAHEEYIDYIFPDEEKQAKNLKILEFAHKWKANKDA